MKTITTLTNRANLAAVDARSRLDSLTSDPELGRLAPVERDILTAAVSVVVLVLTVVAFIATKLGVLG